MPIVGSEDFLRLVGVIIGIANRWLRAGFDIDYQCRRITRSRNWLAVILYPRSDIRRFSFAAKQPKRGFNSLARFHNRRQAQCRRT